VLHGPRLSVDSVPAPEGPAQHSHGRHGSHPFRSALGWRSLATRKSSAVHRRAHSWDSGTRLGPGRRINEARTIASAAGRITLRRVMRFVTPRVRMPLTKLNGAMAQGHSRLDRVGLSAVSLNNAVAAEWRAAHGLTPLPHGTPGAHVDGDQSRASIDGYCWPGEAPGS
jgi:hypothetical protein